MYAERRFDFDLRAVVEEGRKVRHFRGANQAAAFMFRYSVPIAVLIRVVEDRMLWTLH